MELSKIIVLSLFSRNGPNGNPSPKSYPLEYALELVKLLKELNYITYQIGINSEPDIEAEKRSNNLKMSEIVNLLQQSVTFIACDNFLPHLANSINKHGIVIWSQSSPKIFGYQYNINLLKDNKYLRKGRDQFLFWDKINYDIESFVRPQVVIENLQKLKMLSGM